MASSDLATYELQLQQVEAALTTDPDSAELLKLKEDLVQVIDLTKELIAAQDDTPTAATSQGESSKGRKRVFVEDDEEDDDDQPAFSKRSAGDDLVPVKHWRVGELCQAMWSKDGQYYEASIEEITTDGQVSVKFLGYGNQDVTTLGLLKLSSSAAGAAGLSTTLAEKKEMLAKQKEYLKKRKQKKQERFKKMEQEREEEKGKWQNFSHKAFGKKGFVKKSIFKTPENAQGRVGIGTCGVSGKEMTNFSSGPKHRKGV